MKPSTCRVMLATLLPCLGLVNSTEAAIISFQAVDLTDTTVGEDLWEYTYRVSGALFAENTAFEILFDPALYANLENPAPFVNGDWDILTLEPDPLLPDVGRYSALALTNGASLTDPFTLNMVWLGAPGTTPGIQPFEINEFNAQGTLVLTVETGETSAPSGEPQPVPEPGTVALLGVGLGLLSTRILRSGRKRSHS